MLVVLVMECFSVLIITAKACGLFFPLRTSVIKHCISLYADDMVVFVSLVEMDLLLIKAILGLFFRVMGLVANYVKSQAFPIHCDAQHMDLISELLGCVVASFPYTYLRVPLLSARVPKAAMQPLVDKVANCILAWKGRLLNGSGRLVLVQSTLCAIPVHISMALKVVPWAVKTITTLIKGLLWCGTKVASEGKHTVAWVNTCCPKELGGLGIPNLQLMGMALRMRWLWFTRMDPQRTWSGFKFGNETQEKSFFAASISVTVGDGRKAMFWSHTWIRGSSIRSVATTFGAVSPRVRRTRTVRNGILDRVWVRDIIGATTVQVIVQYIRVWDLLLDFILTDTLDRFIWKWTASGEFSSASAYQVLFFGRSHLLGALQLWKTQAPGRVRFFGWLVLHGRCWTSDRLRRHDLSNRHECALCAQEVETLDHLLLGCVHSWETWFRVLRFFGMEDLAPLQEEPVAVWWCRMDLPRLTTTVGTRTDYSVGPWDYSTWAARHLLA
jgi:hypothetical protein